MSAPEKLSTPAIVGIVIKSRARKIVEEFKDGENTRGLSRKYRLTRSGIEDIIRAYGWRTRVRKVART